MKARTLFFSDIKIVFLLTSLFFSFFNNTIYADILLEKKLPELELKLQQLPPHSLQIEVSKIRAIKGAVLTATSAYVPSPPRIVLDIQGVKIAKNQSFNLNSGEVKAIRLGVHPDHCRIVIDLTADGAINSAVEKTADNRILLAFSVKKTSPKTSQDYHQPVKPEPTATIAVQAEMTSTPLPIKTATQIPTNTATAIKNTPTARPTNTALTEKANAVATQKLMVTVEAKAPAAEENLAALPVRKVPAPPTATAQPATPVPATPTAPATSTHTPKPTELPSAPEDVPLSSLREGKSATSDLPANAAPSTADPLSHEGLSDIKDNTSSVPIGPKDATQYLVEVRFDYQIQDHDPLLRLVMMSGANFNLVKKDSQLYQLIVPKSGIKSKVLALPHFPPHDFVGFTLVHPRYENDSLIVDIRVDRGARINAFARGNEIWIRAAVK